VTDTETQAFHADVRWRTLIPRLGSVELGVDANTDDRLAIRRRGPVQRDFIWPDIRYEQVGVFIESRAAPSARTSLRTGLRLDIANSDARMAGEPAFGVPILSLYREYNGPDAGDTRRHDSVLSANALLRFDPDESVTVYAGLGSSAQIPPPTERYRAFLNALGGGFEIGNPALVPERKWELAVGTRFQAGRLTAQLDLFTFLVEDYIWRQSVGSTAGILPLDPPQTVYSYRNVDVAFGGIEFQGQLRVSPHFRIPFSAQFVDARLRESGPAYRKGDPLPELPPAGLRVSGIWDFKLSSIATSFEWAARWTASQRNELPEVDPLYDRSGSYCLHDVNLTLAGYRALSIQLGVRNLFDKAYSPYLAPPTFSLRPASGDLNPGDRVPGPGREWVVSVSSAF
jgi:outer membrane receptor protein involved in Fe transport